MSNGRGGRKSIRLRGDGGHQEQGPLDQLSKAHMNSPRLKQQTQGLHGPGLVPLHIYYSFQLSIFKGHLSRRMSVSLILVSAFRTVPSVGLPCPDLM